MIRRFIRPVPVLVAVLAIVACAKAIDRIVGPSESVDASTRRSRSADEADPGTVFGPRVFSRGTAEPMTESVTIEGFAPEATLQIVNGDANGHLRVTSGTVLVDGREVVHPSDFGQHVAYLNVPITLRNTSVLSVRLAGSPGDRITLSVSGSPATSATVTSEGGSLHFLGSQVTLVAPSGAVGTSVELTAAPEPTPHEGAVPGTSIEMGPSGIVFSSPVMLSIAYAAATLPAGVRASSLRMRWWNADHWEALASNTVDEVHGTVSAQTTHFTTFALLPNEVVFCPGDANAESDLRAAITHIPDGGTVYVCDGTFPVTQVLIDKPMTLRSLHPGGATLLDAAPAGTPNTGPPVLRVNGIASGVVRIADLGIVLSNSGIVPTGTFDRVDIDSVRFAGLTSSGSVAVRVEQSAVGGARVNVLRSEFSQLSLGVWPITGVETNVRSSRFDRFSGGSVVYSSNNSETTQSFGSTEDNVFTNCGPTGCIRVVTAGTVVLARNRLEAMDQSVTLGAITISPPYAFPNAAPTIIEDNVIVSRRTGAAESTPGGWMFQTGISVSDPRDRQYVIRRNRITDVYTGISSTASLASTDNWFSGGVYAIRQTAMRTTTFQRNDVVGLLGSFSTPLVGSNFQCNYWGGPAGPTAPPNASQWAYTPWATEPIAMTSVACDPVPVPPVPTIATLTVSPTTIAMAASTSLQFTATARDANGNTVPVAPQWSVANGGGTIDGAGRFTAGTVSGTFTNTVRATSGTVTGSATVSVAEVASISITPSPGTALAGGTRQFSIIARDANGNIVSIVPTAVWSVTNGGGTINQNGLFTAGAAVGTFANTITATLGALTASVTVSVYELASLTVTPSSRTLSVGATQQFTATGLDPSGVGFPVTPVWSVTNGGGTITANGLFTATTAGTFASTVRATVGAFSAYATVTVTAPVASITVTPNPVTVLAGTTVQFVATGRDASGNVVTISPVWSVAAGGGTITSAGLFTAGTAAGTYANSVRATVGSITGMATVTVSSASLPVVRVCATPGDSTTVPTLAEALGRVVSGGVIRICDGTHVANNLTISKPVTITAAGPGTPLFDAGSQPSTWTVSSTTSGSVHLANLQFRGYRINADVVSSTASLVIEGSKFEDCGTWACVTSSVPSQVTNNTFIAHIASPLSYAIYLGQAATSDRAFTVTDNTITGVGYDSTQVNWWARYPFQSAAIGVLSGTAGVSRNRITNSFWGVIGSIGSPRPGITMTVTDNVVASTYWPVGTLGSGTTPIALTANWNDFVGAIFDIGGPQPGLLNLRCNWWGKTTAPNRMNDQVPPPTAYTPWTTAPVAGQPHTGCDPTGAALASITITPNPDTLVAGGTQQFVATGRDGNGQVISVTPVWSVTSGGGTIDASTGLFTAGAASGTFVNTVQATSGLVSGMASVVVLSPPQVAVVRVCSTSGSGVTVPTVAEALGRVTAGGTVLICDGTHVVSNVVISKPVTITADGLGRPTLDGAGSDRVFTVSNVSGGAVTISKLRFVGASSHLVQIGVNTSAANIVDNEFQPVATHPYGVAAPVVSTGLSIEGAGIGSVLVDSNRFVGGDASVSASDLVSAHVQVTRNSFQNVAHSGVNFGHSLSSDGPVPPSLVIESNTFDACGVACVMAFLSSRIANNVFTASIANPTGRSAIQIGAPLTSQAPYVISGNTITGVDNGSSDPSQQDWYPLPSGVLILAGQAVLDHNQITNAYHGIEFSGPPASDSASHSVTAIAATDNTIRNTFAPLSYFDLSGAFRASIVLNWNDFGEYRTGAEVYSVSSITLNFRCNWWGQATGPVAIDASLLAPTYTPFAVAPVAGQAHTGCAP